MDTITQRRIALIMAGGSGERFWPLSRYHKPKLFHRLASGTQMLLEQTRANIEPLFPREQIFLATGNHLVSVIRKTLPDIFPGNIIAEPLKRNTAGCLIYAVATLLSRYGGDGYDITMAVLPADHTIGNLTVFRTIIEAAMTAAEKENALITLGITPDRPETGYGYLELAPHALPGTGTSGALPVFPVARFHEKPDRKTAETYLASGKFLWNSGMFFWRLSTFIKDLDQAAPELGASLKNTTEALDSDDRKGVLTIFEGIENISIDCALMEKAQRVLALKADFGWDDVGAWDALDRTFTRDEHGNVSVGEPVLIDSKDCIVYNEPGKENMAVSVIGVEGLAVITTHDAVLVIPKSRAQDVRKAVEELKKRKARQV